MENANNEWHTVCITDKSGKQSFKANCSPLSTMPEIRNLKRHLENAKKFPNKYKFLDIESAHIILDGKPFFTNSDLDWAEFDDLLNDLAA